jgi:hypothetical protein
MGGFGGEKIKTWGEKIKTWGEKIKTWGDYSLYIYIIYIYI